MTVGQLSSQYWTGLLQIFDHYESFAGVREFLHTASVIAKPSCLALLSKSPTMVPFAELSPGGLGNYCPLLVAVASLWRPYLTGNIPLPPIWRPKDTNTS